MKPRAIGVILPVHNEETLLPTALQALDAARRRLARDIPSVVAVVLDACSDRSASIAHRWSRQVGRDSALVVTTEARNVGEARKAGATAVLAHFAEVPADHLWLATTDADSQVPPTWLTQQVAHHDAGTALWTGRVEIADWDGRAPVIAMRWRRDYSAEARPVHGASMGIRASAYLAVGGFVPLRTGEDRSLHDAVLALGAPVRHGGGAPVITSARRAARAPLGFAHALSSYEDAGDSELGLRDEQPA